MSARGLVRLPVLALVASLVIGLIVVATGTAVEVSSQPKFCGSCHVMTPYYESWKTSSHRNVACVECHIAPGVTAEIRKKYEALSMVTSYFTGTYGTNPWAEIDDLACLKCHERRLLAGKELFGDVLFDHSAHLAGMRRGKTLKCTSCHSQIVQGSHIAVTSSTCILCHFKGQTSGTGTARCTLCHLVPDKVVEHGTLKFDHADVQKFGMDCTSCHAKPEGTDGLVPKERCVTCHNDPSRLKEYDDTELLHRKHVTEHKVDCLNCHLEIQHVGPPRIETAATACATCHLKGHSPQMNLYAGIGGRGVDPMPDPMFLAGVQCEGCHLSIPGHTTDTRRASEVSCMSCHGPTYRRLFLAWKEDLGRRTTALQEQIARTASGMGGAAAGELENARQNLDLVVEGRGIHNVRFARALLGKAHADMNLARTSRGLQPLPLPWAAAAYDSPCLTCHEGIESQKGEIFGRGFRHEPHVAGAKVECASCHRPHEEREKGEVVRFDAGGCESCHHREAKTDCLTCHEGIRGSKLATHLGQFDHAFHLDEAGQTCVDCHDLSPGKPVRLKKDHCVECHG